LESNGGRCCKRLGAKHELSNLHCWPRLQKLAENGSCHHDDRRLSLGHSGSSNRPGERYHVFWFCFLADFPFRKVKIPYFPAMLVITESEKNLKYAEISYSIDNKTFRSSELFNSSQSPCVEIQEPKNGNTVCHLAFSVDHDQDLEVRFRAKIGPFTLVKTERISQNRSKLSLLIGFCVGVPLCLVLLVASLWVVQRRRFKAAFPKAKAGCEDCCGKYNAQ